MVVLVTGASGFIGANVARSFMERGYQVRALVRKESNTLALQGTSIELAYGDLLDRDSVARALQGCEALIHCAALYTFWARDPAPIYEANVGGTRLVLEEGMKAGVEKCVYTSTVSTIHAPADRPGVEDDWPAEEEMIGHYKRSKHRAEVVARRIGDEGLPVVIVNPTAPVGPWDVKPTPTGRIVLDFIRQRVPACIDTGMNVVDVEDVALGHVLALEKGTPGERYILGNANLTLRQMFGMLEDVSGVPAPRWNLPMWVAVGAAYVDNVIEGGLMRREPAIPLEGVNVARKPVYVKCDKASRELGMPQRPVEEALEKAVGWFRAHSYA